MRPLSTHSVAAFWAELEKIAVLQIKGMSAFPSVTPKAPGVPRMSGAAKPMRPMRPMTVDQPKDIRAQSSIGINTASGATPPVAPQTIVSA